jgi:quercetin dioxygenase-like cupin family protein
VERSVPDRKIGGSARRPQLSGPAGLLGPYAAPGCDISGTARGSTFRPDGSELWRVVGELPAGAELEWASDHGDQGIYVLDGAIAVDGARVGAGSTVLVEAGVHLAVTVAADSKVVHFGSSPIDPAHAGPLGPAAPEGRGIHVIRPDEGGRISTGARGANTVYFGDGTCATCRIVLFVVDHPGDVDGHRSSSHSHSQDEIIHVLDGEIHVGPLAVSPGMAVFVPGNVRYGWHTDGPFRFLNYRRDVSEYMRAPGSEPMLETLTVFGELEQAGITHVHLERPIGGRHMPLATA